MFSPILINFSSKIVNEYLSTKIERVLEHRNCNYHIKNFITISCLYPCILFHTKKSWYYIINNVLSYFNKFFFQNYTEL